MFRYSVFDFRPDRFHSLQYKYHRDSVVFNKENLSGHFTFLKHYLFVVAISFIFFSSNLSAQFEPKRIVEKPKKYQIPENEFDISPTSDIALETPWVVHSDRENNQTFGQPGRQSPYKTIQFLEEFYVVSEQDSFLRIVKDKEPLGLSLSASFTDYGWIHKRNLLLWGHCLVTEKLKGRINRKAMILNTIKHLKGVKEGRADIVEFRNGPDKNSGKTGQKSNLFEFFFVFKTENDWILLAKNELIPTMGSEEDKKFAVVGWAPKSRITRWDYRLAIEPNWELPAVVERKKNNKKASIFGDKVFAKNFKNNVPISREKIIWDNDTYENRPIGEWRRFPILEPDRFDKSILRIGVMGDIILASGDTVKSTDWADKQRQINNLIANRRNVSVVFVIDGTSSMNPYFDAAAKAVVGCIKKLKDEIHSMNNFKFGAVIYRDYAEGEGRLTEVLPLQPDVQRIVSFLDPKKAGDLNDKDVPEAVFYGLKTGLRATGINPDETNILILIGDAGNHHRDDPSQISSDEVINTLFNRECHFLVFQVHNENNPAYDEFITQTRDIILHTATKKFQQIKNAYPNVVLEEPYFDSSGSIYELVGNAYFGAVYGLEKGQILDPDALPPAVEKAILSIDDFNRKLIKEMKIQLEGGKPDFLVNENKNSNETNVSSFAPGILDFLRKAGITLDDLKLFNQPKYQLFVEGATTLDVTGLQKPLFKQVLFLTRDELAKLVQNLDQLSISTDLRQDFANAWKQLLQSYLGKVGEKEMQMPLQDIYEKIFGIPMNSKILGDVRLIDITDEVKFPTEKLIKYSKLMREKADGLRKIKDMDISEYKYGFRSNEQPYLWIDEDLVP